MQIYDKKENYFGLTGVADLTGRLQMFGASNPILPLKKQIMETASTIYLGELRTESTHVRSGEKIKTDAPVDNQGKGEFFSPTDLLAASLGSCMLTVMGIACRTNGINMDGTRISITKVMASNPRRVSEVHVAFEMPGKNYSEREKTILENAARTCPVALSLHPDIKQVLNFKY